VIGIGAAAGGVEALQAMLTAFTLDSSAFVLAAHLPRHQVSFLPELLGRCTVLAVDPAQNGVELLSNHIYVVPRSESVSVSDGRLWFEGYLPTPRGSRNIDYLFQSLAVEYQDESIGVVLSGANGDGAAGLATIRAAGGTTFVQSPESALFTEMPECASASADFQLDPVALGGRLMQLLSARHAR
jgi:two-component system CheB/CheR fusion protein